MFLLQAYVLYNLFIRKYFEQIVLFAYSGFINPIRAGGAESARTFFRWLFLHEKGGLEVPNFVTFPNSL